MNNALKKLTELETLTFTRIPRPDGVQFWCEQINASIFVTAEGIEVAGPDLMGEQLVSAERYEKIHPA